MAKATPKQGFAIFLATGYDVRKVNLSFEQASELIEKGDKAYAEQFIENLAKQNGISLARKSEGKGFSGGEDKNAKWEALYQKAHQAGLDAANKMTPTPMVVQQHADPFDDVSPVAKQWLVNDGVCGFAWVNVRPGNCSFALWLKKNMNAHKGYHGGMELWISQFGQSYERKYAYAAAFANIINQAGIKAYPGGRLD